MVAASAETTYTFASDPRPVQARKHREPAPAAPAYPTNIMYDKRVVRGNTYAAQIVPAPGDDMALPLKPPPAPKSKRPAGPGAPEPVEGRRHADAQTDAYLEELTDAAPEADASAQTDAFLDRPPTPLFVPAKSGSDAATQIEGGDLFDFDFECEPLLEVLVGKTLEQGLMEVMEEEELAAMRAHQEHFEQVRNAELVATQRMEAAERRKAEEKRRRLAQERERLDREKSVREKVAASVFARGYLGGLVGGVYDKLYEQGFFYDPVEKEVKEGFVPWLKDALSVGVAREAAARATAEELIGAALKALQAKKAASMAKLREQKLKMEAEAKAQHERLAAAEAAALAAMFAESGQIIKLTEEQEQDEHVAAALEGVLDPAVVTAKVEELTVHPEVPEDAEEGAEPPPPVLPEHKAVLEALLADGAITTEKLMEALAAARELRIAAEEAAAAEAAAAEAAAA